ncbi:SEC14 cytosolic factor [Coprinopsis cinerea AmutBmut pab1-1]|nr:SEC14 cytosolic factor [Coprinopsis cinerea AmutBmut pab1-1]
MSESATAPAPSPAQPPAVPEPTPQPEPNVDQNAATKPEEPKATEQDNANTAPAPSEAQLPADSQKTEDPAIVKAAETPSATVDETPAKPAPEPTPEVPQVPATQPEPTPTVSEEPKMTQDPTVTKSEAAPTETTAAAPPAPTPAPAPATSGEPKVEEVTTTSSATAATKTEPGATPDAPAATATAAVAEAPKAEEKQPASEADEPQSTLTKRFTTAEWEALKKFRADLPNIFEEAFPDRKDARTAVVTIWGVPLDPNGTKDARASVVLMKFLRARNLNPTAAREMLVGTLRWRESFNIEAALKEEFPQDLFGKLAHVHGVDKENRPIVYNLYGANPDIKAVFADVQRFIRWRVALQERSTCQLDFTEVDQMIQVHDYEGVGLTSRDANSKAAASEATNIFQSHYPELLYKKFFINVPTLLNWIFWAFKPIIPAATLAKMSVVGSGTSAIKKALGPHIDDNNLPKRYGGASEAF